MYYILVLMIFYLFYQVACDRKSFQGATWLKIFHHDSSSGQYFNNFSEALKCNSNTKFSIIGEIDTTYKFNDKYEFLLESYDWSLSLKSYL